MVLEEYGSRADSWEVNSSHMNFKLSGFATRRPRYHVALSCLREYETQSSIDKGALDLLVVQADQSTPGQLRFPQDALDVHPLETYGLGDFRFAPTDFSVIEKKHPFVFLNMIYFGEVFVHRDEFDLKFLSIPFQSVDLRLEHHPTLPVRTH